MTKTSGLQKWSNLSAGGLLYLVRRWIRGPELPDFSILAQLMVAIALLWLPLVLLSLFEGSFTGTKVAQPLFADIVPHVRFLIAMPLLLLADIVIDPATSAAIRNLESGGTVQDTEHLRFQEALANMRRTRDSVSPDIVIIVLAFGITWLFKPGYGDSALQAVATSWMWSAQDGEVRYSAAGWWYLLLSGPMFQVILFRWIWRFIIWAAFLFRVSRLSLVLRPTDPDLAGGLGYLGIAQQTFVVVFFAFATVASSTIAQEILAEGGTFDDAIPEIIVLVLVFVVIIYAPLLLFSKQLFKARRAGLNEYGSLGYRLSEAFHQKWVREDDEGVGKELLASTDSSTIADYTAAYDNVRAMRSIPATLRGVLTVAVALLVPFLPLALTELSLLDLLKRLTDALV